MHGAEVVELTRGWRPGPGSGRLRRRTAGLRLTVRGRIVLLLVAVGLLVVAFSLGRVSSGAATPARPPVRMLVRPGDTLWSVATRVAPGSDPRVVVERLERLNRLSSPALVPGEQLLVPAGR